MNKEINFLQENNFGYLATADEHGHAFVRGFAIMVSDEGNIQFGTANFKDIYGQLKTNKHIEFITTAKTGESLRVRGEINFEMDRSVVEKFIESNPSASKMYKGNEDAFELFYLNDVKYKWFSWN